MIRSDFQGERSFANRIESACKNLGWKADLFEIRKFRRLKRHSYDFVINLVPGFYNFKNTKYYLAIFHPLHHYFDPDGSLSESYSHYDGYLLTYAPKENDKNFGAAGKPYITWYPTVQTREYKETDPTALFYPACIWGNRFDDTKMQKFLNLLDQEPFTRIYGSPLIKKHCPRSYYSSMRFESDTVCKTAEQAGVTLVLHSNDHIAYGLPSGRIFEAAAASTTIICDENPFVREHFGDSVLYINTGEDAESIHNQVKQHMNWIQSNKQAAKEKARQAHAIYKCSFSLEEQLLRLGAFHDKLSKNTLLEWRTKISSLLSSSLRNLLTVVAPIPPLINPIPVRTIPNIDFHYSLINSVDFHPQRNVVCAVYTHNNKIVLYEIDENHFPRPIQTLCNPHARLSEPQHAVFSPSGDKIVVANWTDRTFNIYPRESDQLYAHTPIATIQPPLNSLRPHGISFSPCGKYLAVAYGAASYVQKAIALFKSEKDNLRCISILTEPSLPGTPKGITFSPDGTHLLVSFCEPSSLALFSIYGEAIDPIPTQILQSTSALLSRPEDVKISPDGSCCAVSNSDQNTLTFYHFDRSTNSITDSAPFYSLENPKAKLAFPHGLAFSSDGAYLAVTQFGQVQISQEGDIIWDQTTPPGEGTINLYRQH